MKLVPLADRVVLKQSTPEEKTKSGIILTSQTQEKPQQAEVVAVGPGGVIDGKVMTAEEIITLAKLPSRETLLSMLAGALLGNISKLAVALDQVKVQKENV